jgi:hypothetical protein
MKCTECDEPIRFVEEDGTVFVIYSGNPPVIEQHCHHNPFDETDPTILAILGSEDCTRKWLSTEGTNHVN